MTSSERTWLSKPRPARCCAFARGGTSFVVLDSVGAPFLAPGATLPLAVSALVSAASDGEPSQAPIELSDTPLERLMLSLGLRYVLTVPLASGDQPTGALLLAWDTEQPQEPNASELAAVHLPALMGALALMEQRGRAVLVCHEDQMVAAGLARTIEQQLGATANVACSLERTLAFLATRPPDLIVCSDHLSEDIRLQEVARKLRAAGAAAPLLVLARTSGPYGLERALMAGATGYLPLSLASECLADTASALLAGRSMLPALRPTAADAPRLTRREQDVLAGLDRGLSDKQIAYELSVAISTVKTHTRAIYSKLEACSRTAAVHKARQLGLI
jgi:DNA-binding NarL/FixJ family response regulator